MRTRLHASALLVAALLCAACGARLDDEQIAAAGASGGGLTPATVAGNRTATTAAGGPTAPGAVPGAPTPGAEGGAPAPAPEGGAPTGDPAAQCVPEPVEEVGVSDTEIVLGNISTISGPIAGFGQTGVNATKAYVNYVNATGGVCGRQLKLVTGDDRLDAGSNRSETQRLADEVLGFVGAVTVVDNGGAGVLAGTNIPDVGLTIGGERAKLPNNFSPNPIDYTKPGNASIPPFRYFAQQGVTSAAIIWPAQADARGRGQGYQYDLQQAGITKIDTYEVAITETNYRSVAQQIKNAGTQLVVTTLEVSGMARLAQAFDQVGYKPQVPFYGAQAYGRQFIELAGPAADGTKLAVTYSIFEDAGNVPAVATFLEWYRRTAPGSEPDFFAIMSWAAADMMVDAIREAGGAPTRDKVLERLKTYTAFTADGFLAPRNPPGKAMGECFAVITVEGGQWRRIEPATGFLGC